MSGLLQDSSINKEDKSIIGIDDNEGQNAGRDADDNLQKDPSSSEERGEDEDRDSNS